MKKQLLLISFCVMAMSLEACQHEPMDMDIESDTDDVEMSFAGQSKASITRQVLTDGDESNTPAEPEYQDPFWG